MTAGDFEGDRLKVNCLVNSDNFNHLIMFLILFDAVILGFLTSDFVRISLGFELFLLDRLIVALFISEMMMKIYAYRGGFFKNGWNILDLSVVILSIIPATSYFVILRSFRLLRLVKYIDNSLRITPFVNAMLSMMPMLSTALVSFAFILYVFGIMSVGMFSSTFVEFESLGTSMFTLLQMLVFDGVSGNVIKSIMYVCPFVWVYFLSFILISYLIVITFVILSIKKILEK